MRLHTNAGEQKGYENVGESFNKLLRWCVVRDLGGSNVRTKLLRDMTIKTPNFSSEIIESGTTAVFTKVRGKTPI